MQLCDTENKEITNTLIIFLVGEAFTALQIFILATITCYTVHLS